VTTAISVSERILAAEYRRDYVVFTKTAIKAELVGDCVARRAAENLRGCD
jgi:hypothetical protein